MTATLTMREGAAKTALSTHTRNDYERVDLLNAPSRAASGQRRLGKEDLEWLALLKHLQATRTSIWEM